MLAVTLVLGVGGSLIIYVHGASWWYAPLAVLGVVLAHVVVFSGIVLVVTRFIRARRAPEGADQSQLIRWPRRYDWLVSVLMLGREKKLRRWVLDRADLQPGGEVLDVGCGTGTLLLAAAERVGPSGTLRGIEPAAEMATHAQQKAKTRGITLEITEGSADRLPYPSATFDAVFCTLVLHHVPGSQRSDAVREIRRVLRPGGRAVIVDLQRPRSLARALTSAMSLISILHNLGPATSRFDVTEFGPLMTELGFEEVTQHSFGSGAIGALVGRLGSGP